MESLFQTDAWAQFKKAAGWTAQRHGDFFGLTRRGPLGKSLVYFPELPFNQTSLDLVKLLTQKRHASAIFTRFEFLEPWEQEKGDQLAKLGLKKSFEEVQPEYRQWVDLAKSEEEILAQMKPKGRYNIKLALGNQLAVEHATSPHAAQEFYRLYQAAATRSGFQGRSANYFEQLVTLLAENNWGEVILVRFEGKALAGAIISYYGGLASYLYGGSSNEHRELMAPYLAHWEAIITAKKRGCLIYDLLALAPPDANEKHKYAGITRFKSQFGGQAVRLLGSWDLVHRPTWYKIYQTVETRRRKIT